jgi:Stress responsive A/B Barrel Domain
MILHCVFIRFKDSVKGDARQALYDDIAALKGVIPGILDIKSGKNNSPEGLHGGFENGFIVTFESEEARDAYLPHPAHMAVGSRIVEAAEGGLSGIMVFDMPV